jgi:hypothetical protein
VNSEIHHDLETITLKALEKRKFKRYSSCAVFQEDLKRFLNGSPILAKPITPLDQLKKKIQRHRSKFIVGGLVFLGMSLFFTLALWRSFQKKQKQAQGFYQQAKKVFEEAEKTLSTPPSLQAERLFKALDFIDESLVLQAQNVQAQQLKVEISQKLIAQTCTFKEYHFAGYLLQDLRNRHLISSAQHQAKLQEIQELQAQQKKNNLQRFKEMIEELRTQSLYPWRVEDYIFEISQMKEKEIVEELESLVKEGTTYFLHSKKHLQKSQLYGSAVSALGRVSSNKEVLLEALDQMMKKLIPLAEKKRSISESEYAAKLVHALGNLKSSDSLYLLYRYVKEMGQYSLFSLKSLDALRKLAKEAPIEAPSTAIDYMMKGYQESLRHENEKAFESYHQALERDPQLIEAYLLRGRLYNDHAHFEKSVQDFNTLLSQKLDSPSLLSEVYLNRGYAFQRWGFDLRKSNPNEMEKKFTQAFYDFNQAIQHQKKSEEVYFRRGFFLCDER